MSLNNRYDFVLLFDVKDGNPNGDPDAGNYPRIDNVSGCGLVTDVSLKRKVRNFVEMVKSGDPRFGIYIKERAILNKQHELAYREAGFGAELDAAQAEAADSGKSKARGQSKRKRIGSEAAVEAARDWLCQHFFDIRTFGAVMSTGVNCGQVRGPVQLTFARSIDPIRVQEHSITRMAVTTVEAAEEQEGDNRTMGRKYTVPYGLYAVHGFISGYLAQKSGFSEEDLELFWQAVVQMFEHDRAAARGEMSTRGLYVFKHNSLLGNAQAQSLFDRIKVQRKEGVEIASRFSDYEIVVDESDMPGGVSLIRMI